MLFEYDATTTRILGMPPYFLFTIIGVVFASSLFMLFLLKYGYSIPRYTKIFFFSAGGLLIGAKLFGCLTGLYIALANNEPITLETFLNTGIVFYGGLIGFILSFLLICKIWNKKIDYGVVDLIAVCMPLFHSFARLGCFFAGCCYGIESDSWLSVRYTTRLYEETFTALRLPIQLIEAFVNILIFIILLFLLYKGKFRSHLLKVYLLMYATARIMLEFFRGDIVRGVWSGISLSQFISALIIISCTSLLIIKKPKENNYGIL